MTNIVTPTENTDTQTYPPLVQRLMTVGKGQHIGEWFLSDDMEHVDYDRETFTRTVTTPFSPAIEYRSGTRYLYLLPDYSISVLWTPADYTEFDTYAGTISVPDGYELWVNNAWLVLSDGIGIDNELGNWTPATPLHTVTADIASVIATHHRDIESGEPAINLEDYDLQATEPDDADVEEAIIDSEYDSLRYEYGRAVADQWAKEKREAIHQWMLHHDQQVIDSQRKADNR